MSHVIIGAEASSVLDRLPGALASPLPHVFRLGATLLLVASLFQPFWALGEGFGSGSATVAFYGDRRVTTIAFSTSSSTVTHEDLYSSSEFSQPHLASLFGLVRSLTLASMAFAVLALAVGILTLRKGSSSAPMVLLDLITLGGSVGAAAYMVLFLPTATADDQLTSAITSAWGSRQEGPFTETWAPTVGWYLLVVGAAMATLALVTALLLRTHVHPRNQPGP